MEINSNEFDDSCDESPEPTKRVTQSSEYNLGNTTGSKYQIQRNVVAQRKWPQEHLAKDEMIVKQSINSGKDKNFTFLQSEIDAEMAKNILYSEAPFQNQGLQSGNFNLNSQFNKTTSSTSNHWV